MTHTFLPVWAFGPPVGSDRSVPLYSAATVAWAFATPGAVDDAPDPDVLAAEDELPVDDELLLLLPQAATMAHAATTAAIVPMRLRIFHTPFSIDLSPPTRPRLNVRSSGKPNPAPFRTVLVRDVPTL
jgi:hypothetical protein